MEELENSAFAKEIHNFEQETPESILCARCGHSWVSDVHPHPFVRSDIIWICRCGHSKRWMFHQVESI